MKDIYRLRNIVKQEKAARSTSSDDGQPGYEYSEGGPIKEEDETPTIQLEDASETGSTTEVDETLEGLDEQSDACTDTGIPTSPQSGFAIPHLYTAGAAAGMESAASPIVPAASMEPAVSPVMPAASMESAALSVVPAASMASAALPVVPATQATHYIAPPPPVPPPHDMPMPWYMPPPIIAYIPFPPYEMTLYPLHPVYFPPPTR